MELDRDELGNNRENPSSYNRNRCILQYMLIDDRFENRQSGRPKILDIHIWSKAAGIFKIKACGLTCVSTTSILRIWDEECAILVNDGTFTSNSDCTSARQLNQADLSSIDDYISDCHKRRGTVTINFIRATLAGFLKGDIADYLRMHGCKQLKVELDDGRIMYHEVADDRLKSRDKQFIWNMGVSQGSGISLV